MPAMRNIYFLLFIFYYTSSAAQVVKLEDCFRLAAANNLTVQQAQTSLRAGEYNLQAEKKSYLPKVDLLSSYTYLSSPLTINLQEARNGIVEGSSRQSVNAANEVFREITGTDLSQPVQDRIYKTSSTIIGSLYPDYNPQLSQRSYFMAGLGVRQPLWLGNKLDAAKNIAAAAVSSQRINVDVAQKEVNFLIASQYIRILYLNTMLTKQEAIVASLNKNKSYADEMVKNDVLPPYQRSWTNVVLTQAKAHYNNLLLEKKNAIPELNKLMGQTLDAETNIVDTLRYVGTDMIEPEGEFWVKNPLYQLANSKSAYSRTSEKVSKSFSLPNIFAVGNYNLYQRDLPVTIPDWFVGLEMQWTLFNGQTRKRTQAAKELIEEAELAQKNASQSLQVQLMVAKNKVVALQNDLKSLESAKTEAITTTRLIQKRMENQLSSPKDVNDALLVEVEIEKAYATAVLGYYLALTEYYNILGNPMEIAKHIQ